MKFGEGLSIGMTVIVLGFVMVIVLPAVISTSDTEEKTLYISWKEVEYIGGDQTTTPHNVYLAYDSDGNKYFVDDAVYQLLVVGCDNKVAITSFKRSLISEPQPTITAVHIPDYWGR